MSREGGRREKRKMEKGGHSMGCRKECEGVGRNKRKQKGE